MRILWLGIQSSYSHSATALPLLAMAADGILPIEWLRVDSVISDAPVEVAARVIATSPELICCSLYLFNRQAALETLSRVHQLNPRLPIAVGGPECLGEGAVELLRRYPFITYAFRGEGEELFRAFIKRWWDGGHAPISGIAERNGPGDIIDDGGSGVDCEWPERLPAVFSPLFLSDRPFVQIETSRGCPMGCTYCTSCHSPLRFRSLPAVREELQLLQAKGIREIRLLDRTFNVPDDRGAALLKLFRDDFPEMHFHLELHPGVLGPAVRSELLQARPGQLFVEVGIQSTKEKVLEAVGRSGAIRDALDGLSFLCSLGSRFETHADLLTGLPLQRLEDVFDDVTALLDTGVAEIQMEVLKILPGTVLKSQASRWGLCYAAETPYDVMKTPELSLSDMQICRQLSRLLDIFHNCSALREVYTAAHHLNSHFTRQLLEWCRMQSPELLSGPSSLRHRMDSLLRYMTDGSRSGALNEAMDALSIAWMRHAFAPGQGAAVSCRSMKKLPGDAIVTADMSQLVRHPSTRLYQLTLLSGERICFLYNRAIAPNHSVGEIRL